MRVICCLFLLLPACTSHAVRCDGHLQPVNLPAAARAGGGVSGVAGGGVSGSAAGAAAGAGAEAAATGVAVRVPPRSLP